MLICFSLLLLLIFVFAVDTNDENIDNSLIESVEKVKDIVENQDESNVEEIDNSLIESAEKVKNIFENVMNQDESDVEESDNSLIESDEKVKDIVRNPKNQDEETQESMFVTDIRGGFYENATDIPQTMQYLYLRSSDGAVLQGTLSPYYIRYGYIGPLPLQEYFQAFYEGTLYFSYYDN